MQAAIDTGDLPAMRVRLFLELVDELDNLRKREAQRPGGEGWRAPASLGRRVLGLDLGKRAPVDLVARAGEFGDDTDRLRQFVMGECRFPVDSEIAERRWCARIGGHDDGHTDLSHDRIQGEEGARFRPRRMVEQDALDLHRIDVEAAADEHLFHPPPQPEDAVVVAGGEIAVRSQPSTSVSAVPAGSFQ